jgi:hypothetical protein
VIEVCHWCKVSLYREDEKLRDAQVVYCADGEACNARLLERKARFRDLCEAQRISAAEERTRSYYI